MIVPTLSMWLALCLTSNIIKDGLGLQLMMGPVRRKLPHPENIKDCGRRDALIRTVAASGALTIATKYPVLARAREPGSTNLTESVQQIRDAAGALRQLRSDWSQYATIDGEGRAGDTTGARRILGGVAPQTGAVAIEVAKATPLYRIDGAFGAVRRAAIDSEGGSWESSIDLTTFDELAEEILFGVQKADGDFYSVLFASKGTKQISGIYSEAKIQIDRCILDFEKMVLVLKDAGAPDI